MRERDADPRTRPRIRARGRARLLRFSIAVGISAVAAGAVAFDVVRATDSPADQQQARSVNPLAQEPVSGVAGDTAWLHDALEVPAASPFERAHVAEEPHPEAEEEDPLPVAATPGPEPAVDPVQQVPTETVATLRAGGDAATVATMSGTGAVTFGFTRASSSTAPNLPTYVSTICDGASVYSGAFNTTTQGPVVQDVPYSGADCAVSVRVAQPSARWLGTSSAVVVTRDAHEAQTGTPFVGKAEWTTVPVTSADSFGLAVPEGFTGAVSLKLTACSSEGGTSDATREFACGDMVQEGVGTEGTITVSDGEQVLAEAAFDITAETHHDMVTVGVDEPAAGGLTIVVERSAGSAVLVHGPGTGAVGTH